MDIANLAAVVGDRRVTDPWLEWLFSRTFIYPLPVGGIQDTMISGTNREGTEFVGSTYYAQGEGASRVAASLEQYLRAGGDPQYDLSDRRRYPKPAAHLDWRLENVVGGRDFLRIGDVCGPDKGPGHTLRDLEFARAGWRWTRDPKFAFLVHHRLGRGQETDAEWSEIVAAAGRQRRAPWLDNRSRVLPTWAGILEAGLEHDDYRFRRAARVRVGYGVGHEHQDALDLQVVAHGLPLTIDGGQRRGYTVPTDSASFVHNSAGDVFAAIIEPYAGEPFITARRELAVPGNEDDARRAVAVEVRTAGGHRDVCFADGRPDRLRDVPDAGLKVAGEFALYATDADGLRQVTLVGGRRLEAAEVRLVPAAAERGGQVVRADYPGKRLWIDQAWPARSTAAAFEIGVPGHQTTYTALSIQPAEGGSLLALDRGADYFRSQIAEVDATAGIVTATLRPLVEQIDHDRDGWVASDDERQTFWRAKYLGSGRFQLTGAPVNQAAFGRANILRLWECGVGDHVRQSTSVSVRRVAAGVFEVQTDVPVAVGLRGSQLEVSGGAADGSRTVEAADGWASVDLPPSDAAYRLHVRE